ncbi:hypothetical protein [Nocardia lijiangensis]|uniref:hypothetical protein n=1 Tax=Nocardia lijiangensis TaxID=299618 RepID=UPI000AF8DA90|nr:hypothetical protein [Nocardia lijiangensis]
MSNAPVSLTPEEYVARYLKLGKINFWLHTDPTEDGWLIASQGNPPRSLTVTRSKEPETLAENLKPLDDWLSTTTPQSPRNLDIIFNDSEGRYYPEAQQQTPYPPALCHSTGPRLADGSRRHQVHLDIR